jgi:hypothetical protein
MTTRDATTTRRRVTTTTTASSSFATRDDATETETTTVMASAPPIFLDARARRRRDHDALALEFALGERAPVTVGAVERRRRGKRAVPDARASRDSWRLGAQNEDEDEDEDAEDERTRAFLRRMTTVPPGCTKHVPSDLSTALAVRTNAASASRERERDPTRGVARLDVPRASSKYDAFR